MRTIATEEITRNIKEMCIEANHFLSSDMEQAMKCAAQTEQSPLGKQILGQLQDNLEIAGKEMIPICQDTGMAVIFLEIGQEVHFEGGNLTNAVNEGVGQGTGQDHGGAERLWQREHEQSVYAKTCRRRGGSEGCDSYGCEGRRSQCLPAHGGGCRHRRHI